MKFSIENPDNTKHGLNKFKFTFLQLLIRKIGTDLSKNIVILLFQFNFVILKNG